LGTTSSSLGWFWISLASLATLSSTLSATSPPCAATRAGCLRGWFR
jgi:hypothetical protein